MKNPFEIVRAFEKRVAEYTGAPYAVAVDSCTNAIFLCCMYEGVAGEQLFIPKHTYLSVPMAAIHAGANVEFEDVQWEGVYQLWPFPIIDAAKRFRKGMYEKMGMHMCLSFHQKKHLPIGKGGMILTADKCAAIWFKKARYEGRSEKPYKEDKINMLGWNMYMTPEQAARGLWLMQHIEDDNPDLPEPDGYKDLTELPVFQQYLKNKC